MAIVGIVISNKNSSRNNGNLDFNESNNNYRKKELVVYYFDSKEEQI